MYIEVRHSVVPDAACDSVALRVLFWLLVCVLLNRSWVPTHVGLLSGHAQEGRMHLLK